MDNTGGGAFPILNALTAKFFGVTHIGKIFDFTTIGDAIGGILRLWLAGYIFDITANYSLIFLIVSISTGVAIVLIFFIRKRSEEPSTAEL